MLQVPSLIVLGAGGELDAFFAVVGGSIGILVGIFVLIWIVRQFMFICRPNQILIFSGRERTGASGKVGYRVIHGGRAFRWPFLEEVDAMDLSVSEVQVSTRNAFCKGGIRLDVDAIANVKVSDDPQIYGNAIERFLGQDHSEIDAVACNTLEGHLRAVIATLTPEEVNEDRLKFSERLQHEAEMDLLKLGIHLDTFNIHSVGDVDGSSYLAEIGRKSIAEVVKNAEIAEAICERAATESEAQAASDAGVAKEKAETAIRVRNNELRTAKAEFEARAKSQEEQAEAARDTARARAELELQQVRSRLEGKRLEAEVVVKAEAEAKANELHARGEAAPVLERGRAMAGALEQVRQAWAEAGDGAKPIFMIQQIDQVLREVVKRVEGIRVGSVNLIDQGDGSSVPAYVASFPATVNAVLRELDQITGIDVVGAIGGVDLNTGLSKKGGA